MPKLGSKAVSNTVFAASIVILLLVAGVGFGLYATRPITVTSTVTTTAMAETGMSTTMAETGMTAKANFSLVRSFTPKAGAMISNAWLIVASVGMGEYAVVVHAEGLEANGDYIVEGPLTTGKMQTVPISTESMGMNTTAASEFTADSHGTGLYWIVLNSNPTQAFEAIQLYFLPGMSMQNATLVASVMFPMMSG